MYKTIIKTINILFIFGLFIIPSFVFGLDINSAVNSAANAAQQGANSLNNLQGIDSAMVGLEASAGQAFGSSANTKKNLTDIVSQGIQIVLSFVGVIFMILIIVGGIIWMTAGGDEGKVKKARQMMTNATIGLAAILIAYAFTIFVVKTIIKAVGG